MLKRMMLLFVLALVSAPAFALEDAYVVGGENYSRVKRFDAGVYGAFTSVNAEDADSSGLIAGKASYGLSPSGAIGIDGGWTATGNDGPQATDFDIAFFMVEMIVRFDHLREAFQRPLVPYAVFGAGGIWTSTEGATPNDRSSGAFGWKIGVGADYFINRDWALFAEIDYYNAEGDLPVSGRTIDDNELDFWTFGGGAKRVF